MLPDLEHAWRRVMRDELEPLRSEIRSLRAALEARRTPALSPEARCLLDQLHAWMGGASWRTAELLNACTLPTADRKALSDALLAYAATLDPKAQPPAVSTLDPMKAGHLLRRLVSASEGASRRLVAPTMEHKARLWRVEEGGI